eukprot:14855417-Alexandrium_andersonii.AAC.1
MRRPLRDGIRAARLRKARRDGAGTRRRSSKRPAQLGLRARSLVQALPRELAHAVAGLSMRNWAMLAALAPRG